MRRGEVPFVAIRVGRSHDAKEVLGLAAELKIQRATALGFVALWEEFLLEVGDNLTGRVSGYKPHHLAANFNRSRFRLVRAGDDLDQRRFPRPVFTDQRVHLGRPQFKRNAFQRLHAAERFRNGSQLEK